MIGQGVIGLHSTKGNSGWLSRDTFFCD